jgi:hypothetical protein
MQVLVYRSPVAEIERRGRPKPTIRWRVHKPVKSFCKIWSLLIVSHKYIDQSKKDNNHLSIRNVNTHIENTNNRKTVLSLSLITPKVQICSFLSLSKISRVSDPQVLRLEFSMEKSFRNRSLMIPYTTDSLAWRRLSTG